MSGFDCNRPISRLVCAMAYDTSEQDCSGAFAQNHSSTLLTEWLNRRLQPKQPPASISIAQKPIDFFGADDEAMVKRLIRHQVLGHFYRQQPHRSISHESISGTGNPENCREMARRRIKHRFWK